MDDFLLSRLSNSEYVVLSLIQSAIWDSPISDSMHDVLWNEILEISVKHAIAPLVWAGIRRNAHALNVPDDISSTFRTMTISSVLSGEHILAAQQGILAVFSAKRIPAVVHKGAAIARLYPQPNIRPMGDIDILVKASDYERAARVLEAVGYRRSDEEHFYHIVLFGQGVTVEIHNAVARTPNGKAGEHLSSMMSTAVENAIMVDMNGYSFPALPAQYQAIALLMHMQKHMVSSGIGLKQLCDWMMFATTINRNGWCGILEDLSSIGLLRYAMIMTKVCVMHLGLNSDNCIWCMDVDDSICELAINDVFRAGNITVRNTDQGHSSIFLEDVGHFASPLKGRLRTLHIMLYRLDKRTCVQVNKATRIVIIRPVLWLICGVSLMCSHKNIRRIMNGRLIANERRKLYNAAKFFQTEEV